MSSVALSGLASGPWVLFVLFPSDDGLTVWVYSNVL